MMDKARWLVEVPLAVASTTTPGWEFLRVVDNATGRRLERVTRVDTGAGLVWIHHPGFKRSWPRSGDFRLLCPPQVRERFQEVWERWK